MQDFGAGMPDWMVAEAAKDEDWYRRVNQYYLRYNVTSGFSGRYQAFRTDLQVYNLQDDGEVFEFLQTTEGGDVLPAVWANYSSLRVKINTAINEIWARGDDIDVVATNHAAASRKLDVRMQQLALTNIYGDLQELEQQSEGMLPTAPDLPHPPTQQGVEEWLKKSYKDEAAEYVQEALNYLVEKFNWLYHKYALYRYVKIHGCCFNENRIVNGIPRWFYHDPRKIGFDIYATDDFLATATFFTKVDFLPIPDVISEYKLSKDQVANLKPGMGGMYNYGNLLDSGNSFNGTMNWGTNSVSFFQQVGAENRVMVHKVWFKDVTTKAYKFYDDKNGTPWSEKVADTYEPPEKTRDKTEVIKNQESVWRECVMIAANIMPKGSYRICENLVKSVDDHGEASCPIQACIPGFVGARIVSMPSQVKPIQDFKNAVLYNMQAEINASPGTVLSIDVDRIPDKYDTDWVIKNIKAYKINFYSSSARGYVNNSPMMSSQDLSAGKKVEQCLAIAQFLDAQIDLVTNITQARVGQQQSANQGLGVTQTLQQNSYLSTEHEPRIFNMFCERVLNHYAGLIKICATNEEIFANLIGDKCVKFFQSDIDLFLQDYGVFVKSQPKIASDKELYQRTLDIGLQQGAFGQGLEAIAMYLEAAMEPDAKVFIKTAKEKIAADKVDQQAHDATMQQMQGEQMQAQQQQALAATEGKIAFTEEQKHNRQAANNQQKFGNTIATNQQKAALDVRKLAHKASLDNQGTEQKAMIDLHADHVNANFDAQLEKYKAILRPKITDKTKKKAK